MARVRASAVCASDHFSECVSEQTEIEQFLTRLTGYWHGTDWPGVTRNHLDCKSVFFR